jgi:hypothetical protein
MIKKAQSGFAMLFTVLIISVILSIALGISDLTFKQTLLSNSAKNSQLAFYQADSGVECGLYYDVTLGQLPAGTDITKAPNQLTCGGNTATLVAAQSRTDYFIYQEDITDASPCFSITFDKTHQLVADKYNVSSRGYSTCQSTPQQVERGLNVSY